MTLTSSAIFSIFLFWKILNVFSHSSLSLVRERQRSPLSRPHKPAAPCLKHCAEFPLVTCLPAQETVPELGGVRRGAVLTVSARPQRSVFHPLKRSHFFCNCPVPSGPVGTWDLKDKKIFSSADFTRPRLASAFHFGTSGPAPTPLHPPPVSPWPAHIRKVGCHHHHLNSHHSEDFPADGFWCLVRVA